MNDPTSGTRWPCTDKSLFSLSELKQRVTACDEGVFIGHEDWEALVNKIEIINYCFWEARYNDVQRTNDFLFEIREALRLDAERAGQE